MNAMATIITFTLFDCLNALTAMTARAKEKTTMKAYIAFSINPRPPRKDDESAP
jgi:hypothetical protein